MPHITHIALTTELHPKMVLGSRALLVTGSKTLQFTYPLFVFISCAVSLRTKCKSQMLQLEFPL